MWADFFKSNYKKITIVVLCFWFAGIAILCGVISQTQPIYLRKKFYFLVSSSTHIQASTHFVEWSGGAGYLLDYDGSAQVVFSVYLQEQDSLQVQSVLTDKQTDVLTVSVESIYLYRKQDKAKKSAIKGAFQTLYNCCELLEKIIDRYAQGGTQESGKRLLKVLQEQLCFLSKEYTKSFPQYADVCQKGAEKILQLLETTVYLKDLRYLLCELCVSYMDLADTF
jgi:hypothetical protein